MRLASTRITCVVAVCALLMGARSAHAGGFLAVNGAGEPLRWGTSSVTYNLDRGTLGTLSNSDVQSRFAAAGAVWSAVPSANVSLSASTQLPVDVTVSNYISYLTDCSDGLSPMIFDTNGQITDDLYGEGANTSILGFAAPACGTYVPAEFTEGFAVFNGRFLDGVDSPSNPELEPDGLNPVLTHELGHYLGLDHSQVNFAEAADGDPVNDAAIATMFPILISPTEELSLHLDDVVAISSLYPAASFATDFGEISGSIFLGDGVTAFQGANVIARNVADPRITAVSQVSGARYFPGSDGGPPDAALRGHYELKGLPPGTYTVEIESIYGGFAGGSSVGPLDPPAALPGMPEFWNDANEAATNPPDDPVEAGEVVVTAGATVGSIDFLINHGPPQANDECADAIDVASMPFDVSADVTRATRGAFDPLQLCTVFPSQNYNSLWYRFTPAVDGVLLASTASSNYDTVVSALTGECGLLNETGCDDNGGPGVTSSMRMFAEAGVPYLVTVTSKQDGGGQMNLALDFAPAASCSATPASDCITPTGTARASLRLRRGDPEDFGLQWKWGIGEATAAEVGDPTSGTGTSYALCIYDGGDNRVLSARAPAGTRCGSGADDCWNARSTKVSYRDDERLPDGLQSISLGVSASDSKFKVKGAGASLDMPVLPLAFPLTAQLVNSDGSCWESSFQMGDMLRNDTAQLKARTK